MEKGSQQTENKQISNLEKNKQKAGIKPLDITKCNQKNVIQDTLTIFYNEQEQDWTIYNSEPIVKDKIQNFTTLTYNIWFKDHHFMERVTEIKKIITEKDPDFICLQEVTERFQNFIQQDKEFTKKYYISGNKLQNYGCTILSKYPISYKLVELDSDMGRSLIFGQTQINGQNVIIATAHLESLQENKDKRVKQLQAIKDILQKQESSSILFMGDLNFDESKDEQSVLENGFQDTWSQLKPNDKGHTQHSAKDGFGPWRPDKVYVNSKLLTATCIELVGVDPIPFYQGKKVEDGEITTPSDHYGLYTKFQLNQ